MRLGDVLLEARLLTSWRLDDALRAQVMWGGRLGTNLVELGLIDLEALTTVLARLHRMPAAFSRHFTAATAALQKRVAAEVADANACIPLRETSGGQIIVAMLGPPTPTELAAVAAGLGVESTRVIPAIAPELRIRYQLENIYGIPRSARFLRSSTRDATFPAISAETLGDGLDEADTTFRHVEDLGDGSVTVAFSGRLDTAEPAETSGREEPVPTIESLGAGEAASAEEESDEAARARRRYVPTLANPEARAIGRIAMNRISVRRDIVEKASEPDLSTLPDAIRSVKRATSREQVAELIMEALQRHVDAGLAGCLLVVRGDVATSWRGYSRASQDLVETSVPLDHRGLVSSAIANRATARAVRNALGPIDRRLLDSLDPTGAELAVLPLTIAGQVLVVLVLALRGDVLSLREPESVASAGAMVFARLIRDATR